MARYFSVAQAERLLPAVEVELRQAIRLKQEHADAEQDLQRFTQRISMMGGVMLDRAELLKRRARLDATTMRLREIIEGIQQLGVQIKDLDIGLIDFPTRLHGREVLLCWRLGETGIRYWHGLEEGFRGRKEIDEDFLANHRGDAEV